MPGATEPVTWARGARGHAGPPNSAGEPAEFMHHCSTKWAYHLLGLKAWLEGGQATPFPEDLHLSANWP